MRYIITILVSLVIFGCGGSDQKAAKKSSSSNTSFTEKDTKTPAEKGGYGFENIANSLGFTNL